MAVNKIIKGDGSVLLDLTEDTVTSADHIKLGRTGHLADGTIVTGTGFFEGSASLTSSEKQYLINLLNDEIGGTPSATAHTIHFEFDGNYSPVNITFYADSIFILDAIRATTPSTYDSKTVTLAELDGVAWYEPSAIPLNTQLIDFSKVTNDYIINSSGQAVAEQWYSCSDYTPIASGMAFTYRGCRWFYAAYYDSSKTFISSFYIENNKTSVSQDNSNVGIGELSTGIPANAAYIRITSVGYPDDSKLSLIRTA